ncbi:MAG: hypothetical protein GX896_03120 [Clostridiales bacterium]|nr:hypothetical protein [Clostridiales bacterium]
MEIEELRINNSTVRIHDDNLKNVSKDELKRRRENFEKVVIRAFKTLSPEKQKIVMSK